MLRYAFVAILLHIKARTFLIRSDLPLKDLFPFQINLEPWM